MARKFLKLDRQITRSAIWNDGTPFDKAHAWMDLLLYVNYAPSDRMFGNKIVKVKRGQTIVSDNFLANRWNWSRARVRRYLEMLEMANMIKVERTSYGTWINVVNYTKYQGAWTPNDTSNDTSVDTSFDTGNDTQLIEGIEDVKRMKEREGQAPHSPFVPTDSFVEKYCADNGLKINIQRFMAYYGARNWTLGKGMKIESPAQLEQLIRSWSTTYVEEELKKESDVSMPYFEEFKDNSLQLGTEPKYDGGVVAEMIRRKRAKHA